MKQIIGDRVYNSNGKRRATCGGCGNPCRISHNFNGKLEDIRCFKCRTERELAKA